MERLKAEGEPTQFLPVLIKLMGFPADSTKKTFKEQASEVSDGVSRLANVVFSKPSSGDEPAPVGLYWSTRLEANRKSESYDYRTALDGSLEKATRIDGKLDENGKVVRGAGKVTELDVRSAEVRERFQREVLDFWLKGKGRKKAGPQAPKKPSKP